MLHKSKPVETVYVDAVRGHDGNVVAVRVDKTGNAIKGESHQTIPAAEFDRKYEKVERRPRESKKPAVGADAGDGKK